MDENNKELECMRALLSMQSYLCDLRIALLHDEYLIAKWRVDRVLSVIDGLGENEFVGKGEALSIKHSDPKRNELLENVVLKCMSEVTLAGDALFMRSPEMTFQRRVATISDALTNMRALISLWLFEASLDSN